MSEVSHPQTEAHTESAKASGAHENMYDAIVVGGGPAGLTAAIYLARARYRVLVVEKKEFGGRITITNEVVNYPGVMRISGKELTDTMRHQAENFGAEMLLAQVTNIEADGDIKRVHTTRGTFECFGIILAIGSAPRQLGFPGEKKFQGHGVAYCATCDGEFFTGKDIFVVGGGYAAAEESVFLTKYAKHVHILVREEDFTCAPASAEAAYANEKITVHTHTEVKRLEGDTVPRKLITKNNQTGAEEIYEAAEGDTFGVFVLAGYAPETELVKDIVELDGRGNIITDAYKKTSTEGVYAAGDVCVKGLRQVVTATGDAAAAATDLERLLASMQKKTGIVPIRPVSRVNSAGSSENNTASAASSGDAPVSKNASAKKQGAQAILSDAMVSQLAPLFARMEHSVTLKLYLDETPLARELEAYAKELSGLCEKINVVKASAEELSQEPHLPCVRICDADKKMCGIGFHGVPGGHEFTSFMLGVYNASGTGQTLSDTQRASIAALPACNIKLLVSLSCTMCPDTVVAAQRIATLNPHITAEAYDIAHFSALKEQYNVMSVPCIVVNDGKKIDFGRKTVDEMIDLIKVAQEA